MQLSYDHRGNSVPTILLLMQQRLYAQGGLQVLVFFLFLILASNTFPQCCVRATFSNHSYASIAYFISSIIFIELLNSYVQAEGIFRINAENSQEEFVRNQLNGGVVPEGIDVHCLAGLIKVYFWCRITMEPFLTYFIFHVVIMPSELIIYLQIWDTAHVLVPYCWLHVVENCN